MNNNLENKTKTVKKSSRTKHFHIGNQKNGKNSHFCGVAYFKDAEPEYLFSKDAAAHVSPGSWKPLTRGLPRLKIDLQKKQSKVGFQCALIYAWSGSEYNTLTCSLAENKGFWKDADEPTNLSVPIAQYKIWICKTGFPKDFTTDEIVNIYHNEETELRAAYERLCPDKTHKYARIFKLNEKKCIGHFVVKQTVAYLANGKSYSTQTVEVKLYGKKGTEQILKDNQILEQIL